ncbi:hypothetical protein [Achromobacter pulmonis]|uniref:hypothetical protein n=1 Tax=Achromobacter pulmonis TaxID=1389932 RepID=UPI0011B27C4B|nr:hypothetical protein [Achromobacter pulmonis]
MSKPNLPPLPTERIGGKEMSQVWFRAHEVRAYAEEAVRQALAAQVPVAWVIHARKELSDPQFCWGNPAGIYQSIYVPLALIPEKGDGHIPR